MIVGFWMCHDRSNPTLPQAPPCGPYAKYKANTARMQSIKQARLVKQPGFVVFYHL